MSWLGVTRVTLLGMADRLPLQQDAGVPGPRPAGGGDPDLGPHRLLHRRAPRHLRGQGGPLGGTDSPVPQVPHTLEQGTLPVEEED